MKPTKSILILISLFLMFSCEDKEEELPNELSLDWILLKKGVNSIYYIESCDGYIEYNCNGLNGEVNCGGNSLETMGIEYLDSCSGYDLCELDNYLKNDYDCCYEDIHPTDSVITYISIHYYIYEYKLYWNKDLSLSIPSNIPKRSNINYYCECEYVEYFHPNCDTPLDTIITIGSKNISFEKMGWLDRESDNSLGYITYLRNEEYLQNEGNDIDISNWKVVDYQIKE